MFAFAILVRELRENCVRPGASRVLGYVKKVLLLELKLLIEFSFKIWRAFYLRVFVYFFFVISKPAGASPSLISRLAIFHLILVDQPLTDRIHAFSRSLYIHNPARKPSCLPIAYTSLKFSVTTEGVLFSVQR